VILFAIIFLDTNLDHTKNLVRDPIIETAHKIDKNPKVLTTTMLGSSLPSPIRLKRMRKFVSPEGNVSTRVKTAEDTLAEISTACKNIGVTRISDITHMDSLYIPNYSAILPGTEDSIWVYGGKGSTKAHAKASALMESIERYCSLYSNYSKSLVQGTYSKLSKRYDKVLHPDEVVEPVKGGNNDSPMDFLTGFDILNNVEVLVPAQLVFSKFAAKSPSVNTFLYSHTNGLASGNVLEEAVCHGLCEVIERDAASIADLCTSSIPYTFLEKVTNLRDNWGQEKYSVTRFAQDTFVDDPNIFPDVDISEVAEQCKPIKFLVKKFADAGLSLLVKDITQKDIGIATFVASSIEWITSDYGYFAKGYGTHLDARTALIRAITELSQTRAANVQGARDDLKKIQYKENDEIYKRKWQFMPAASLPTINFSEIKTYVQMDILDDIKLILNRLKKSGLKRAIIVDLTNPRVGIPVVRVIVPGLETFEVAKLFTDTKLFMGSRAKECFRMILHSWQKASLRSN
jgi:ribosomal protein S12 methylthiotransferase accessory factor YcaO